MTNIKTVLKAPNLMSIIPEMMYEREHGTQKKISGLSGCVIREERIPQTRHTTLSAPFREL